MLDLKNEISRITTENQDTATFSQGVPILTAFGCALLEKETDSGYTYTAVNLTSGKTAVISRLKNAMSTRSVETMVRRIQQSPVAGYSRYQADRGIKERITEKQTLEILNAVFRKVLLQNGYTVHENQILLAEHILGTIKNRSITLAESGVGTGKTDAYLVPAILAKRGRLCDDKNTSLYPSMQYAAMSSMPIVIATSSIALQKAIITDYIPELSRIMIENGIIKEPLTAAMRKGREHYICRRNLLAGLTFESNPRTRQILESLLLPNAAIDLAEVDAGPSGARLPPRTKKEIGVPGRCFDTCKHREDCPYLEFREKAQSYDVDIQVCNQNYLLADTLRRAKNGTGLIPNYQTLVIDEAHKFVTGAARTMYSSNISSQSATDILNEVGKINFKRAGYEKVSRRAAKKLSDVSFRLFANLTANAKCLSDEDDEKHFTVIIGNNAARDIENISRITEELILLLRDELVRVKAIELLSWVRKKYDADTNDVDLKHLLYVNPDEPITREEQEKRVQSQVIQLHRVICNIPKIKQMAELERRQRQQRRYSYNPERQAIANEKSAVNGSIWR
ncbi:hypothetical protein FACS189499_06300 [Clostridia bacterium]|nr:hypothetical protein FACS189499_06300 [Clostridia bacterium]